MNWWGMRYIYPIIPALNVSRPHICIVFYCLIAYRGQVSGSRLHKHFIMDVQILLHLFPLLIVQCPYCSSLHWALMLASILWSIVCNYYQQQVEGTCTWYLFPGAWKIDFSSTWEWGYNILIGRNGQGRGRGIQYQLLLSVDYFRRWVSMSGQFVRCEYKWSSEYL